MESALFSAYHNHARTEARATNADATFLVTFDDFYGDAWDVGRLAVAY